MKTGYPYKVTIIASRCLGDKETRVVLYSDILAAAPSDTVFGELDSSRRVQQMRKLWISIKFAKFCRHLKWSESRRLRDNLLWICAWLISLTINYVQFLLRRPVRIVLPRCVQKRSEKVTREVPSILHPSSSAIRLLYRSANRDYQVCCELSQYSSSVFSTLRIIYTGGKIPQELL